MKKSSLSLSLRLCMASFVLAAGTACSQAPQATAGVAPGVTSPVPAAASAAPAASLAQQITEQIGDAACDTSQQCRTLAVGHKACGGPAGYRAWSTKRGDGALLTQLAARQAEEQKKADAASGMMSTCAMVMDPGATCSAGRCVLNKAGNGAQ